MGESVQRSTFINVLAWIFIILGGFGTFISLLQNIMIRLMLPRDEVARELLNGSEAAEQVPAFAIFFMSRVDIIFLLYFLLSLVTLISSIALLKRQNWARLAFIAIMALGIVWNLAGVVVQFTMFGSMQKSAGTLPPEFETMRNIMMGASFVMAAAITILFGWIIRKLISGPIREEFA